MLVFVMVPGAVVALLAAVGCNVSAAKMNITISIDPRSNVKCLGEEFSAGQLLVTLRESHSSAEGPTSIFTYYCYYL